MFSQAVQTSAGIDELEKLRKVSSPFNITAVSSGDLRYANWDYWCPISQDSSDISRSVPRNTAERLDEIEINWAREVADARARAINQLGLRVALGHAAQIFFQPAATDRDHPFVSRNRVPTVSPIPVTRKSAVLSLAADCNRHSVNAGGTGRVFNRG